LIATPGALPFRIKPDPYNLRLCALCAMPGDNPRAPRAVTFKNEKSEASASFVKRTPRPNFLFRSGERKRSVEKKSDCVT
jgi:hypothetical protein